MAHGPRSGHGRPGACLEEKVSKSIVKNCENKKLQFRVRVAKVGVTISAYLQQLSANAEAGVTRHTTHPVSNSPPEPLQLALFGELIRINIKAAWGG